MNKKFIIIIPLYNDWKSAFKLLKEIDLITSNWKAEISILIIDDASTEKMDKIKLNLKKINIIKILNMKKNQVHQRCIATGLKFIYEKEQFDYAIIMDADGEDKPEELNKLYENVLLHPSKTITADRVKRSENLIFRVMYSMHKLITFILTGKIIKFGNFSCLPREHVKKLLNKPSLWNVYCSSVIETIENRISVRSVRGYRYYGPSKMSFPSLILHSFSIMSVFKKIVVIRLFFIVTIYLMIFHDNLSITTLSPLLIILAFLILIINLSKRSNIKLLNESLNNIKNIQIL